MKKVYFVEMDPAHMAKRVETEFRKNEDIHDLEVINKLLFRAELDFKEMLFHHMQRGHVSQWFAENTMETMQKNLLEDEDNWDELE